jgi:phage terminase Nu1 subunit (DNA packaging protein)
MPNDVDTTEESSTAEVVKTDKKYSDEEVQRIVKERISREKEASKKIKEEFDSYKSASEEDLTFMRGILEKDIAAQLETLPQAIRDLVTQLPLKGQVDWLAKNPVIEKHEVPGTPPAKVKNLSEAQAYREASLQKLKP